MDYETGINWNSCSAEASRLEMLAKYSADMQRLNNNVFAPQWNADRKKAIYGKDYIPSGGNTLKKLQSKPNITKRA